MKNIDVYDTMVGRKVYISLRVIDPAWVLDEYREGEIVDTIDEGRSMVRVGKGLLYCLPNASIIMGCDVTEEILSKVV
jgi:hypothetical protein